METRRVPVTRDGLERLKAELEELKEVRRPQIVAEVAEARSHGDLRENAAYDAARHDQAMNEKRIGELEALLRSAVIMDEDEVRDRDSVGIGSTVVVDFEGDEERYTIVGAIEAKPAAGLISNESPIGKALLGKRPGQDAFVMTPGGQTKLTVKRIEG
ncbi:MAG: transcription elongation factor GreA [Chloroflexota bacterium]|nr:transcription elongation factor GreA [Chloroflexota bacterium]MDP9472646.1 transcription elongation factor GreA [Chloroflexota bacterium]